MTTMQTTCLLILLLASVASLARSEDDVRTNFKPYRLTWETFKKDFDRRYSPEEDEWRFRVFVEKVKQMERHNQLYLQNRESFTMAINEFTDKKDEETVFNCHVEEDDIIIRETTHSSHHRRHKRQTPFCRSYTTPKGSKVPSSFDWRTRGVVTPVHDQGTCASCYTFGVTATIAAQLKLVTGGKLTEMSQQQVVDCYGGCKGGSAESSFRYIHDAGGIMSYTDYPYRNETFVSGENGTCDFKRTKVKALVKGCLTSSYNERALKYMVALEGPVYASMDVVPLFKSYGKGVFSDPNCVSTNGHCVTVIGYGTDTLARKDYWIIKNSWGEGWGIKGFGLIERGRNMCSIGRRITVPEVEAPDSSSLMSSSLMATILCGLLWPFRLMTV